MQLLIPPWMVLAAAGIGGFLGGFVFLALVWKMYLDTDSARHNYMARQIAGLRSKHNDYERLQADPFPPSGKLARATHWLLDKLYGRGRPQDPRRAS